MRFKTVLGVSVLIACIIPTAFSQDGVFGKQLFTNESI